MKIQRGFTLIEMAVVVSLIVFLLGFITISLLRSQQTASLVSVENVLVSDLKQQQLKAMVGDTEGRSTNDAYGIHFDVNRYVLFHGTTYSSSDTANYAINLDDIQFNNPGYDVIFSKMSGEISAPVIIELQQTNSDLKKIHLNIYGAITQME